MKCIICKKQYYKQIYMKNMENCCQKCIKKYINVGYILLELKYSKR
jgi:hypothetical protein